MIQDFELHVERLSESGGYVWRCRNLIHAGRGRVHWSVWAEGRGETAAECLEAVRRHQVELQGGGRFPRRTKSAARPSKPKPEDDGREDV